MTNHGDVAATMRRLKACVLIPTYNNAGTLGRVVSEVLEYSRDVIVVNDGSTDSTSRILDGFGDAIRVVGYDRNRGKGHALKVGFQAALEAGYDYAITLDSDGQHYASDLPRLVRAIGEHPGALIIGERDLSGVDINGKSSFANKFSNFWFCVQTGRRLKDTQTGYRAYPLRNLHGLSILTSRYEAELELMVFAAWHGVKIVPVPINVFYPPQSERISHFKPALDFTRISILNTILCIAAIFYGLPLAIRNIFRDKKLFRKGFRPFTHKKGERRKAALTLDRIGRSIYALTAFLLMVGLFAPFVAINFAGGERGERGGERGERKKKRLHGMLRKISAFLVKGFPGCRAIISNPDGETFGEPAMIVCNHQSHLDLPVLMSVSPRLIFLTNDRVWNNPLYGSIIHKAEFLPVSAGMEEIIPKLRNLTERGYSVVVFPEGTRSEDCSILRFHQGAFYIARELGLDIVPMVLHGAGDYLPKNEFMFRRGGITLDLLPRISSEELSDTTLRKQASLFRSMIRSEYEKRAETKENADYFRNLVMLKYAYRGWATVARCKRTLKEGMRFREIIDSSKGKRRVSIFNSGIGTFALWYALVNKATEVYAFESDVAAYSIASETAGLPANLHFIHAVMESEFEAGCADADLTIHLESEKEVVAGNGEKIYLPLKS